MLDILEKEPYEKLIKLDFLEKNEIHFFLFGSNFPVFLKSIKSNWDDETYLISPLREAVEKLCSLIDEHIDNAVQLEKLIASPSIIDRHLFPQCESIAFPIRGKGYAIIQVLTRLKEKEFPIQNSLIKAIQESQWDDAINLIPELHENMLALARAVEEGLQTGKVELEPIVSEFSRDWFNEQRQESISDVASEVAQAPSVSSANLQSEPFDIEAFLKNLKFCYSEPHVFINEAGKRPVPFTLHSIGFHSPDGVIAQDFISILNKSNGPFYELGASHSYPGSGRRQIKDVSLEGVCESQDEEEGEPETSTGLSEVHLKTENAKYRARKKRLESINKKICQFIEKIFSITLGDGFKLYENIAGQKRGVYRFKFQTRKIAPVDPESYSGMTLDQILKKLKTLSQTEKTDNDDINEKDTDEYLNLFRHAINQGIPESEIVNHIKP